MTQTFQSRLLLSAGLLLPLILAYSTCADEKDDRKDLKHLQGTWIVVEAERDGQPLDRIKGNQLIVKDNQFTVVTKTAELKGDITLDAAKKPKRIDMQHQEGMLLEKKWEGIYKLEGDKLTLCYTEADSGKDRPGEFASQADSSRLLIVMERKKP